MEDNRKWCYGLNEHGKWYDGAPYVLDEKWEAIEKGEELAKYEGLNSFYVGKIGENGEIEEIEKLEVR